GSQRRSLGRVPIPPPLPARHSGAMTQRLSPFRHARAEALPQTKGPGMTRKRPITAIAGTAAVALIALTVAACGGGGNGTTAASAPQGNGSSSSQPAVPAAQTASPPPAAAPTTTESPSASGIPQNNGG